MLSCMEWFIEFQCGRMNTNDSECPECLNEVTAEEMVNKFHNIVLEES